MFTELGNYSEASNILQKSLDVHYNIETFSLLGCIKALEGRKEAAHEMIKQIQSRSEQNCTYSVVLSRIYLALGEKDIAYEFLETAFEQHDVDLIALNSDPRWKEIRNESRFKDLVKRIGIPA